jgi:hypothetical protein
MPADEIMQYIYMRDYGFIVKQNTKEKTRTLTRQSEKGKNKFEKVK